MALATVLSTTGGSNEYVSHEVEYTLVNIQDDQAFLFVLRFFSLFDILIIG